MISIDEHHEAIACVSDIDLDHTNNNNPLPNFSIRDYVYVSRCKDIARNWPFSSETLQLCLKSGVKNLLPPFESLDSFRSYSCVAKNRLPNEEKVRSLDGKSTDDRIIKIASSSIRSQCLLEEKLAHTKSKSQPSVMKLNSGVDLVKEIIASKVCPVCKTFSSSSNNTLNAHIDRCLSGETSVKLPESPKVKMVKHRIKPRNTRLMLDIYKTAPHCTIEELDRRNGTNWATNSSFHDQELEFQAEENQDEPQEPTFTPEIAEHENYEGDVYIDTNGTKVRILSTLRFSKLDDNEARILQKGGKKIKSVTKKKKGDVQNIQRKIMKLSPSSNKMLSKKISKKIVDKHAISGQEENDDIEKSCNKEDEGERPMKTQGHKRMDDLAITRPPWACSQRTGLAKKRKFQDSLKQKSRMEEDTREKLSFDSPVNDFKVKKKKSVTSNSSNENYSSGRVEITSESAGIDQVPFQGSFMGLRNSMDDEFSKMVTQLDNNFDAQDDIENQGSYYEKVDPIPIPGPPGSFLPLSPGADDMVSEEEEEEVQGNSSLTTTSRVQSSDQDHNHNDMMNRDFISDSPISNVSSPTPQDKKYVNTSDLRSVDAIFTEKGPTPCRCLRKEGAYHQESSERVLESNTRPNNLNFRPDLLSLTLPLPQTFKSPADSSINLPVSPTTPVLRLMGKNLIVVNTDEQFRPPFGSSPMGHQPFHDIQNENHNNFVFYGYPPQHGSMPQYNNYHPPNYSRSLSDLRPVHALDKMFHCRTNGLMAPANYHRLDTRMETDVNLDNALSKATKEVIVIDDSSEDVADEHMFNGHMRRNKASSMHGSQHSFTTQSPLRSISHMSSISTAYYQRSFSLPTTRREDRV